MTERLARARLRDAQAMLDHHRHLAAQIRRDLVLHTARLEKAVADAERELDAASCRELEGCRPTDVAGGPVRSFCCEGLKMVQRVAEKLELARGLGGALMAADAAGASADAADAAMAWLARYGGDNLPDVLGLALYRAEAEAEARAERAAEAVQRFRNALREGDAAGAREIENTFCEG
jgi:hypothetical protein